VSAFINEKLVPVKSNAGKSRLFMSYSLKGATQFGVPQTIFTDATGKEIGRIVGYRAPAQFQQEMDSILGDRVT
jgi:thioredoxin-related protein